MGKSRTSTSFRRRENSRRSPDSNHTSGTQRVTRGAIDSRLLEEIVSIGAQRWSRASAERRSDCARVWVRDRFLWRADRREAHVVAAKPLEPVGARARPKHGADFLQQAAAL